MNDQDAPHRKRNKKFNLEGHAHFLTCSCYQRLPLLTNNLWRQWLADSIRQACDQHDVALWAYVFMPEHIHLLLKPRRAKYKLSEFEHDFKLSSSRRILTELRRNRSALLEKLRVTNSSGKSAYRFWQRGGGHDLNIWSPAKALEKAEYCHWNPIKRRLVASPDLWRFSSFRTLVLQDCSDTPLLIDDWDDSLVS